jgi:8-oxo-dGTP pyrophosphatase MutT (NUDIX family)
MPKEGLPRWEQRGSRQVAHTRILDLDLVTYHHPGRNVDREFVVIKTSDWVNVVAVTKDAQLVLVKQFRFGTNDFSLEIPGGIIEAGEDPVVAGGRELREETGYAGASRFLAKAHPNPAIQSNWVHFVLAENVERGHGLEWDRDEEIEVELRPIEEVLAMVRAGQITHSLTVCALMHFEGYWRGKPRP